MAITYRWEILRLQVKPAAEGQQNVLHRIHWRLWGKLEDETGVYEASIEDSTTLRFFLFSSLTCNFLQICSQCSGNKSCGLKYGIFSISISEFSMASFK